MSQGHSSSADSVPLFACTKCNSRHPFEDLSQGHQLCKSCKGSLQVVKCNYCRSEFQQETGTKSSHCICKKCDMLQEQHGKPGPCAYCNIIAAFIGTKCQRCTNSEKRYGPPMSCEHCRQRCAFDRKDPESKKKVDGKLLCWLCTMAYKRTLAKARQKEAILKSTLGGSSSGSYSHHRLNGSGDSKSYSSSSSVATGGAAAALNNHRNNRNSSSTNPHDLHRTGSSSTHKSHTHNKHSHLQSSSNHHGVDHRDSSSASIGSKKPRMDLTSSSNGHLSSSLPMLSSLSDNRFIEPNNNSDLGAIITQLKDQVSLLNKRIQLKDKELLSKDQQIADLKSTNAREQRELREKISSLQKQHNERTSEMQAKLVGMQKQIASQTKASRANNTPSSIIIEPPLVI